MDSRRLSLIVTNLIPVFILAACNLTSSGAPSGTKTSATATPVILAAPTMSGPVASATPLAGAPTLTTSASGSGGCVNEYFPVSSGATWSYASSGSVAGDYSYTRSLAGISDTGFTTSDEFSTGVIRTTKWGCKDGNLTALETGSAGGIVSSTGLTVTIDSVNANGYIIPATFEVGQTWSEKLELNTTNEAKGKKTGTGQSVSQTNCTAGDTESVTVPAGKFDAVKVNCTVSTTITATVNGVANPPNTFITDTTQWFAKGVGTVKSISTGDGGNETIVLTNYTIP